MMHICLHFNHDENWLLYIIGLLKEMLPEYEIHHSSVKNGHLIQLDVEESYEFYLAYGFLSFYGGKKYDNLNV